MSLAPRLRAPTSARRKDQLWTEILSAAKESGVSKRSLVVLAALRFISVPSGGSPAKRLLKLGGEYSQEDSYNALADLRSLEILMSLFGLFLTQQLMLCTGDKNLALFWAGMRASDFGWDGKHVDFQIAPLETLLPGTTPAQKESFFGADGLHTNRSKRMSRRVRSTITPRCEFRYRMSGWLPFGCQMCRSNAN